MTEKRCGCCDGTRAITPEPAGNRPGLGALRYRAGTHGTFFETMVADLTRHRFPDGRRPLERLTTRALDDPAIALLDGWATVADVLTFYQERIANEGYLLTATERRSILELARLVGYRLRPGVAASVFLAFTMEKDYRIDVPAGTRGQSIPGPGQLPQFFETDEALPARTEWNAIPARITRPTFLRPDAEFTGTRRFTVTGAVTTIRANDVILLACGETTQPYRVLAVEPDAVANRTVVTYTPYGGLIPPAPDDSDDDESTAPGQTLSVGGAAPSASTPPLTRLGGVVNALRKDASVPPPSRFQLARSAGQTYNASADLGPRLMTQFDRRLGDSLYTAYAAAPVTSQSTCEALSLRLNTAPFGHNAPFETLVEKERVSRREWALAEFRATLGVTIASTDASIPNLTDAFTREVDFAARTFPPLNFHLTVADEIGATPLDVRPGDLGEVTNPVLSGRRLFYELYTVRGVAVGIVALYRVSEGDTGFLEAVTAGFMSGAEVRTALIQISTDLPARNVDVTVNGSEERHLSPGQPVVIDLTGRKATLSLLPEFTALQITFDESHFATGVTTRLLSLDGVYDGIVAGSRVIVDRPDREPQAATVESVRTLSRADYGIAARVTQLLLDRPWLLPTDAYLPVLRGTTVHAQSEVLPLAEEAISVDVGGAEIELDRLYDGLEAGRWLMVKGIRTDIPGLEEDGVEATELAMLAGVVHDVQKVEDEDGNALVDDNGNEIELPGDTLHTRVILSEPLAYTYRRDSFTLNANVVRATHGETKTEILGSGDGRLAFQQFTLRQKPLTFLAAPTPSGVESTLEVRVNDVRWPERETLLGAGPGERGYTTRADDEARVTLTFGDGVRGARLPTGVENVSAVYRVGIGRGGNVGAKEISVLASRPLGVKEVINPQRASGGADAETRDQARRNAPVAVLALDRLVSVQDYADFARVFAGIGKASAASLSDGRRRVVHLTVAGADDIPIDPTSDLYRNLLLALAKFGDPALPLQVAVREAVFVFISARVKVLPDYRWEDVEPKVRAALLDVLGFDRRELGQPVLLGEVIATVQAIEGVDYVDVDLLDGVSEGDAADPETLAAKLASFAASTDPSSPSCGCGCDEKPRQRVTADLARVDPSAADPALRLRPAQMAYLNPALPDTLVLTEVTA